jgi:hypothetical protein
VSHNANFTPETTARRVDYFNIFNGAATATVDIRNPVYRLGFTPGANNNFINPDLLFGTFAQGQGLYRIDFPIGHPSYGRGYSTEISVCDPAIAAFSSPKPLTIMGWGAANAAGDPIGIRTAYGPNAPYRAVYQNSQWEKVGLRMANQADAAGGAVVDAEARTALNGLLAKLRSAGVMI